MSDATQQTASIETPDAEVELSAQDLLALAGPCNSNEPASAPPNPPQATKTEAVARTSTRPSKFTSRVYGLIAITVGAVGALYVMSAPSDVEPQAQNIQPSQSQSPALAPKSERKAVLFKNPFDANEVFEFPAGTSEAEAREAVAEILMERAMERQRKFDARVSSNS